MIEVVSGEVVNCPLVEVLGDTTTRVAVSSHAELTILASVILLLSELSVIMIVVPNNVSVALNPVESGVNVDWVLVAVPQRPFGVDEISIVVDVAWLRTTLPVIQQHCNRLQLLESVKKLPVHVGS